MKNIFLQFILLLICCFTTGAQATNNEKTPFRYPFSQGDKKWKEFKTPQDRIVALQIPEDVLTKISTEELISCCLDFPYLSDAIFFDDINDGFNSLVSEFNGLRELQKREDRIDALIKTFGLISLDKMYLDDKTTIEIGYNSLKIYILAYMIGRENVIEKLTNKQRNNLLNLIEDYTKTLLLYPSFKNTLGNLAIAELKYTLQSSGNRYISGDYYSTTIYTPNGSPVLAWNLYQNELDEVDKAQLAYSASYNYGATIISEATRAYNCHGYAWNVAEGGDSVWIGLNSITDENIYWTDGSYVEVDESLATKVSYDENTANHSAARITNNLYRSKWGAGPLVEHAPNSCPYNTTMPKKFYRRAIPSISGATLLWNYGEYSVSNLSNDKTVSWSLIGDNASNFTVQNNTPSANQCTITRKSDVEFSGSSALTLSAQISYNAVPVTTITKTICAPYISGSSSPCSNELYHVEGYSSGEYVTWNLSGTGYSVATDIIPTNTEGNNYLGVHRTSAQTYADGTITATISSGGNTLGTVTKNINSAAGFNGTWYKSSNLLPPYTPDATPEDLKCSVYNITAGKQVVLQSDDFVGATITGNYTIYHNNNTVSFFAFSGNNYTIEGYKPGSCMAYKFRFLTGFDPTPLLLNISSTGRDYVFSLQNEQDEDRNAGSEAVKHPIEQWQLTIVQYETGQTMYNGIVKGSSITVNTTGWKPGIYIVMAKANENSTIQKLAITE